MDVVSVLEYTFEVEVDDDSEGVAWVWPRQT